MKTRESGMPDEEMWESFFNPTEVLRQLGLGRDVETVAEFGCGYGTFTIPAALIASGTVHALDIDPEMVTATMGKAERNGLPNVDVHLRDFVAEGTGLPNNSVDYVMLFNILHAENPNQLLSEAYRILHEGGTLGIMHWNHDPNTPRGPSMEIRPKPGQCIQWAAEAGFEIVSESIDLPPYHFGILAQKPDLRSSS